MVLVTKAIKPARFKDEVFFQILDIENLTVAADIELDFGLHVATWKTPVKFEIFVQTGPAAVTVFIGTDNKNFGYVDKATPPHWILPKKKGGTLAFSSGFTRKTTPGIIPSGKGGSSGDTVFAKGVLHPGSKGSKITETIQKKWKSRYKRRMEKAMKRAATASGHSG